jgi:hypothetical protein
MTNPIKLNKRIKRWEKWKKMGRLKYSIMFGLIVGLWNSAFSPLITYSLHKNDKNFGSISFYLSDCIFIFLSSGILVSLIFYFSNWDWAEKNYKKWISERDNEIKERNIIS